MKKVLIISYFFPPCSLTGANRPGYWANKLHKHDLFPIVITRSWNHNIKSYLDLSFPSGDNEVIDTNKKRRVHYLPFRGTLKDRLVAKYGERFGLLRRMLTFGELLLQNFNLKFSSYRSFYRKAKEILDQENDIDTVIISAMPFHQFFIGYKLKKKYRHINWIADYRDEWTSRPNFEGSKTNAFLNWYDRFFEKKWLRSAYCFTYVDDYYVKRIESVNNKQGVVIRNGFNEPTKLESKRIKDGLVLTFAGTLYTHQNIEVFGKGISIFKKKFPQISIQINLLGSVVNAGAEEKIKQAFSDTPELLNITDRIPKKDLEEYYEKSDCLLMFSIEHMENVVPTKVLNYLPLGIPILFSPADGGAIQTLIEETRTGFCPETPQDVSNQLERLMRLKNNGEELLGNVNSDLIHQYSSEFQLEKLAELIKFRVE